MFQFAEDLPIHVPILWRTPHYIKQHRGTVVCRTARAVAERAADVIEELSGRGWSQSSRWTEAHVDRTAPLYGRLKTSAFGDVLLGFEHWVRALDTKMLLS